MSKSVIESHLFESPETWLQALLHRFDLLAESAIQSRGFFHVALSGGSTPKPFYAALNTHRIDWSKVIWWLGDERWVKPDHADSNEKMIRESLGKGISNFQFQSWHPNDDASKAAEAYEKNLIQKTGNPPALNLNLLGMGTDGHTASLFPGTTALQEQKKFAVSNQVPQLNATRVTLTYPALNAARETWFLVKGIDKTSMVDRLLQRDLTIPSAVVSARNQHLYWLKA